MESLPNEIIECILTNPLLSIVDVVNFSSTCSKFREAVNSNISLWKTKYFQRYVSEFLIRDRIWKKKTCFPTATELQNNDSHSYNEGDLIEINLPQNLISNLYTLCTLYTIPVLNFQLYDTCSWWPKTDVDITCEDWYNEFITRTVFEKKVLELLSTMSSKFFHLDMKNIGTSHLDFTVSLINSHKYGYYYLRDFLIALNSLPLSQSLTNKYYGNLLMKHIHKKRCRKIWNNLIQLNSEEQTLEKGAIFVTLWCQEYERGIWEGVSSELDATASKIKHNLLQNVPDHPLKNTPEEVQCQWKYKNITGNMFQPEDCKAIIYAMNYVLFDILKYCVTYDFNDLDKKRCGIDHALLDRKASPIIFAVIYESIARRLGVKIEILEFLDHCLTRWKEDYSVEDSPVHYIRNSSGSIFIKSQCPRRSNSHAVIAPCTMQQIAQKAVLYIYPREQGESHFSLRGALELVLVIKPFSLECSQQLSRSYMLHEMDAKELIAKLKDIRSQMPIAEWQRFQLLLQSLELYQEIWERNYNADRNQTLVVQTRMEGIDFAVGMIVRHKFRDLIGVICGWNLNGEASEGSQNSRQVFYKLLVDDGSYQYAPQENLQILHSPPFVSHPSIGRFFDEYCMTYYKPNKQLQAEYPQDMEALQKILKKDRQN